MQNQVVPEQPKQSANEVEIDLLELWYVLLDKIKLIILAGVVGMLIAGLYSFLIAKPVYRASAQMYVLNAGNGSLVNLSDFQIGNYLAQDYIAMFNVREVNEQVRDNLGLDYTVEKMQDMVSVTNPSNTRILKVSVESNNAAEAMNMANEYVNVASDYISLFMSTERPNVISRAILPEEPIEPRKARNMVLGGGLGALLAAAVVIIRYLLDDSIRSVEDVTRHMNMPVFAVIPMMNDKKKSGNR